MNQTPTSVNKKITGYTHENWRDRDERLYLKTIDDGQKKLPKQTRKLAESLKGLEAKTISTARSKSIFVPAKRRVSGDVTQAVEFGQTLLDPSLGGTPSDSDGAGMAPAAVEKARERNQSISYQAAESNAANNILGTTECLFTSLCVECLEEIGTDPRNMGLTRHLLTSRKKHEVKIWDELLRARKSKSK